MTEAFDWEKPEHLLNFELIGNPLDALLKATENKVEREWPPRLGGSGWHSAPFLIFLKIARWTYVASLYLLADRPEDPKRHLEYAIAIPPLNRTILDLLFNVVFIFDDFDDRLCWYFQSGLEEVERKLARFKRKYSGEPAWTTWFQKTASVGNPFAEGWDKVCAGKSRVTKRFPHPGQVLSKKVRFKEGKSLDFLIHLNDWFYRDLSSSSHGHWGGLTERAAQILRMETKDETQRKLAQKFKSDCMLQQTTLLLALASEIIAAAGFDSKPQAAYLWGILREYWEEAKEVYVMRYGELLI